MEDITDKVQSDPMPTKAYLDSTQGRKALIMDAQHRSEEDSKVVKERMMKQLSYNNLISEIPMTRPLTTATMAASELVRQVVLKSSKWREFLANAANKTPFLFTVDLHTNRPIHGIVVAKDMGDAKVQVHKKLCEAKQELHAKGVIVDVDDINITVVEANFEDPFIWMGQFRY